jgi:hypothetical protein
VRGTEEVAAVADLLVRTEGVRLLQKGTFGEIVLKKV